MNKISVGIIDDHHAVAQGVSFELKKGDDHDVLFVVTEKDKILEALQMQTPDVLIMDVVMPGSMSADMFKEVLKTFPGIKILAYTALNSPAMIELLLKSGVMGYAGKSQPLQDLKEAIKTIFEGSIYLPEEYEFIRKKITSRSTAPELSKREIEILMLIAQEKTTFEIAEQLFITVSTVETHRKNLFQKLNVTNLAGLIKAGINLGYIQ